MLNVALTAFYDAVSLLLRNQIEKRSVLENLDLVLLCLDETIDDGYDSLYPSASVQRADSLRLKNHHRDRCNNHRLPCQSAKGGHDRHRHQRTDDHECVPDRQGEDATANWAVLVRLM